jgi:hypothetical protein
LPDSGESKRLVKYTSGVMLAILGILLAHSTLNVLRGEPGDLYNWVSAATDEEWLAADSLGRLGVRARDRVAFIGRAPNVSWARLARVRIVADCHPEARFWRAPRSQRADLIEKFRRAGASFVVADGNYSVGDLDGWIRLGSTRYYVYRFS